MLDIDFSKIIPRGGSSSNAFEDLCCQLAARTRPSNAGFERYRGAGGDGGIECKVINRSGNTIGWQAKYVFDISGLLSQVKKSFETALSVHSDLTHYVVCFPFDLTTKTTRKGRSQIDKFNEWVRDAEAYAESKGRRLTIQSKSAHDIRDLLLANDASGGLRNYFFSATIFSDQWFANHISTAKTGAGPRYNQKLSLETPLSRWFSSFEESIDWQNQFIEHLNDCRKESVNIRKLIEGKERNSMCPEWPKATCERGINAVSEAQKCLQSMESLATAPTEEGFLCLQASLSQLLDDLTAVESELAADLDANHGEGSSDSKRFRSYMAEYMTSFPAANLDALRKTKGTWSVFSEWLSSPTGFLAFRAIFVLSGAGGAGKTHSLCDIAQHRLDSGAYTCVVYGHQFGGEPDPWTRFLESLGLPLVLGRDGVLDALNAAAECSGKKLVICIDAVNETRPRNYWLNRLAEFAKVVTSREHLKFCVSCRTSFIDACLPKEFADQAIEHKGFSGMEREACNAFFSHYNLEPPLVPILQLELANPLYLKLVCETLQAKGLKQLPKGWFGLSPVIKAFLGNKEQQFATDYAISSGAAIVSGSLLAIAATIAKSGNTTLRWSEAQTAINSARPQAKDIDVLQWLITADLLIEDGPSTNAIGAENVVRPAFERFGDFLVASEILESLTSSNVNGAFRRGGQFSHIVDSIQAIGENTGLLSALSVLLPEKMQGLELTDLVEFDSIWNDVAVIVINSLPWRTVESFSSSTQQILREVLNSPDSYEAMDSLLSVSTQESVIDALWLSEVLRWLPFSKRDGFWCGYLKLGYEGGNIVRRIIEAIRDVDVQKVDDSIAERWCVVLIWFSAAADRRVKDSATRAAIAILRFHSILLPKLVNLLLDTDDDEVRERMLLIAYGVLIHSRNKLVLKKLADDLLKSYASNPTDFQNAIIRDHIRCIAELALCLGCLDPALDPTHPNLPNPDTSPPIPPIEEEEKAWKDETEYGARLLVRSCLHDDFNHYSIGCLRGWVHTMSKPEIGRWIAKRILEDFDYRDSHCSGYDCAVTQESGGGRSKPTWAERIGKKYQWIAMYQLASRLYDSVERKKSSYERTTDRIPLILLEERKLDPTISRPELPELTPSECWWVGGSVDLPSTKHLDYSSWVHLKDDLPSMESLIMPKRHEDQRWIPLNSWLTWSEFRQDRPYDELYRSTWIHLEAFLIPEVQFDEAIRAVSCRNFYGQWMPDCAKWLHVFVGEYPWATACNTEVDEYLGYGTHVEDSELEFIPVYNEIVCEWEYDGTLPKAIYFQVPTRKFFDDGTLWWNGLDGFSGPDGKTVFRDPSASEGGPSMLLADIDDLLTRLKTLRYRLMWTLTGEKYILGNHEHRTPQVTYSQTGFLEVDGNIITGDRVFFDDYNQNQGLAT